MRDREKAKSASLEASDVFKNYVLAIVALLGVLGAALAFLIDLFVKSYEGPGVNRLAMGALGIVSSAGLLLFCSFGFMGVLSLTHGFHRDLKHPFFRCFVMTIMGAAAAVMVTLVWISVGLEQDALDYFGVALRSVLDHLSPP